MSRMICGFNTRIVNPLLSRLKLYLNVYNIKICEILKPGAVDIFFLVINCKIELQLLQSN